MTLFAVVAWLSMAVAAPPLVETRFAQVAPASTPCGCISRSPCRDRAVVLISGLDLHLLRESEIRHARFAPWQQPDSYLVCLLAADADVFTFSYAQWVPVPEIARLPAFHQAIEQIHAAGYAEVILVGHSAGGIVARQFVEENPDAGVTRVVQVSTPNNGSGWAEFAPIVKPLQQPFVDSLRIGIRKCWHENYWHRALPEQMQFVCVIGNQFGGSDGVVSVSSQWPADLREQGVPAVTVWANHESVVAGKVGEWIIARTALADQPRWAPEQVESLRRRLLISPAQGRSPAH